MSTVAEAGIRFLPGDIVRIKETRDVAAVRSTQLHGDMDGWETVYKLFYGADFVVYFPSELELVKRGPENAQYFD